MLDQDIQKVIHSWVIEHHRKTDNKGGDIDSNAHLIELGYLDSLGFIELFSYLENHFGIEINYDVNGVDANEMFSINGLVNLVSKSTES